MVKCSLCGSPGTNASSCPLNLNALSTNPAKHPLAFDVPAPIAAPKPAAWFAGTVEDDAQRARVGRVELAPRRRATPLDPKPAGAAPKKVKCPPGCRVKVHGNKGKKATPKQLEALQKGRDKLCEPKIAALKEELRKLREDFNIF